MKILKNYISFSKLLVFMLVLAFFVILIFDGYIILRLMDYLENGVSLVYATIIGTITSVMSTFGNAVILFGVKNYLNKSGLENSVGYDSKTQTIAEERIKAVMNQTMYDPADEKECDV